MARKFDDLSLFPFLQAQLGDLLARANAAKATTEAGFLEALMRFDDLLAAPGMLAKLPEERREKFSVGYRELGRSVVTTVARSLELAEVVGVLPEEAAKEARVERQMILQNLRRAMPKVMSSTGFLEGMRVYAPSETARIELNADGAMERLLDTLEIIGFDESVISIEKVRPADPKSIPMRVHRKVPVQEPDLCPPGSTLRFTIKPRGKAAEAGGTGSEDAAAGGAGAVERTEGLKAVVEPAVEAEEPGEFRLLLTHLVPAGGEVDAAESGRTRRAQREADDHKLRD